MQTQGAGPFAPGPIGTSGQLGEELALPCAEHLSSQCGVGLGHHDSISLSRPCSVNAELLELVQAQDSGSKEIL